MEKEKKKRLSLREFIQEVLDDEAPRWFWFLMFFMFIFGWFT